MKSYTDGVGGVSLQYPSVWTFSTDGGSYFGSVIAPNAEPLQAVSTFSPHDNYYEHTTLTGLQFMYRRQDASTQTACEAVLRNNPDGAPVEHLSLHGVPFAHLSTGDAGMMKSVSQEVYATWRGGTCYLFEEDLSQIAVGVDDQKTRDLTASEFRALKRHLYEILNSVTFTTPKPASAAQ